MVDQEEIHKKTAIGEVKGCINAVEQLRNNFADLPDKEQAWDDLYRLTQDGVNAVRLGAAEALGSAFPHVSDRKQAWEDLNLLAFDEDCYVRQGIVYAIGSAFPHILDRKQAWEDLDLLAFDEDGYVRRRVAEVLGSAFPHVPDRRLAWKVMRRLTQDEDGYVRTCANHSLGRASIFNANDTEGKRDFRNEIEKALKFFEKASNEATYSNPSSFCLPFYRSFYTITFEKAGAEGEVEKYLAEAKSASEGSENKETLLEAVVNLANALSEAQKVTDFNTMKSDLNAYRQYCDRAADLIGAAERGTPGAARVLRRGLPIIDDRIKEIIREIQEKAEAVCIETQGTGTPYEPLGIEVNKWAGELSDRDYLRNEKNVSRIINSLGEFCNLLPEGEKEYPCKIVEEIREESELEDKLSGIPIVLSYLLPSIKSEIQNAAKPMTDEIRSDEQPSHKTSHSTTVFAESGSTVVVPQTETESGDVTINTAVTKEVRSEEHWSGHQKKTAIEIIAAFAVSIIVAVLSPRYLEDLTPTASTVIASIAFIILLIIILTQNRDRSS